METHLKTLINPLQSETFWFKDRHGLTLTTSYFSDQFLAEITHRIILN